MKEFNPEKLLLDIDDLEAIKTLPNDYLHDKVVLGIDIYKYSQYPLIEQIYIPALFDSLYGGTVANVIKNEPFIFSNYGKSRRDFDQKFISTGDGGFQVFDNPIQAIIFTVYFQLNVIRFNSGSNTNEFRKKIHSLIDSVDLRYCITTDLLYKYRSNYFGPAIINNARIISKDALNRLLVDKNTIKWFSKNINSVENLQDIDKASFLKTKYFKDYDAELTSFLFDENNSIKSVDTLKIGTIASKSSVLEIYNLHIQALLRLAIDKHDYDKFMISVGNLNTSGIQ